MLQLKRGRPLLIPRQIALAEGKARYFTGVPCVRNHICERMVKDHECVECRRLSRRRKDQTEAGRERKKRRRQKAKARFYAQGLKANGRPRKRRAMPFSEDEIRQRSKKRKAMERAALRALIELGIQI